MKPRPFGRCWSWRSRRHWFSPGARVAIDPGRASRRGRSTWCRSRTGRSSSTTSRRCAPRACSRRRSRSSRRAPRLIGAAVGDGSDWDLAVRYVEWPPGQRRRRRARRRAAVHRRRAGARASRATRCSASRSIRTSPTSPAAARRDGAAGSPPRPARARTARCPGGYLLSERAVAMLLDRPRPATRTRSPACAATAARCGAATSTAASPATATRTRCSRATGGCSRTCAGTSTPRRTPAPSSRGRSWSTPPPGSSTRSSAARRSSGPDAAHPRLRRPVLLDRRRRPHRGLADRALDRARRRRAAARGQPAGHQRDRPRSARISRSFVVPTAMRLSVGDGAEVTVT